MMITLNTRSKSPPRTEAMAKLLLRNNPAYSNKVLIGNWLNDRAGSPLSKTGSSSYIASKEEIDYEKLKPESRQNDFRINKFMSLQGNVALLLPHESHEAGGNFVTTSDLVYKHLPKALCGPPLRYYRKCDRSFRPQTDLADYYDNLTEWGLRKHKLREWACTDVSDYNSSLYDDSYSAPLPNQYLQRNERKARDSSFTKSFRFKMTKSK